MKSNIIYQTNNTTITYSTIKRGTSVYQISQINDIFVDDDSFRVDYDYNNEKSDRISMIVKGVIAIILGLFLFYWSIIIALIAIVIGGIMVYFAYTTEIKKAGIAYTLHISFINGARLDISGDQDIIFDMKDAITHAMEN